MARQEQQWVPPQQQQMQQQAPPQQQIPQEFVPGQPQGGGLFGNSNTNDNQLRTDSSSLFQNSASNGFGSTSNANLFGSTLQSFFSPGASMAMRAGGANANLFGSTSQAYPPPSALIAMGAGGANANLFGSALQPYLSPSASIAMGAGGANANPFRSASQPYPPPGASMAMRAGGAAPKPQSGSVADEEELATEGFGADVDTIISEMREVPSQESSWSESGLTATYDIPGLRTINPSYTVRRHRIATIHLKEIQLSYLLVPKLRAAAFLKARLHNTSSIAFLRGPTDLTLDGTFLGNTILPRCSAGETISLSLGVDPSVTVNYGKPTVHRSQSGIINKEGSEIFTRTCKVTNTKSNRPIDGLLLEQKPVSEDDRLRVEILQPKGLKSKGDNVRSGMGVTAGGKEDPKWGQATATLKANGEICWDFKIEASKAAKFVLEYEAKYPSGEVVVGAP